MNASGLRTVPPRQANRVIEDRVSQMLGKHAPGDERDQDIIRNLPVPPVPLRPPLQALAFTYQLAQPGIEGCHAHSVPPLDCRAPANTRSMLVPSRRQNASKLSLVSLAPFKKASHAR